jgi:hypothetical protein
MAAIVAAGCSSISRMRTVNLPLTAKDLLSIAS